MYRLSRTATRILIGIAMLAAAAAGTVAAQERAARWETVETVVAAEPSPDDFEVNVRDNYIYVYVSRPTTVRLLTILGQPVSQANLPAGTSRFRVRARGIYILKAGSSTRRVTV